MVPSSPLPESREPCLRWGEGCIRAWSQSSVCSYPSAFRPFPPGGHLFSLVSFLSFFRYGSFVLALTALVGASSALLKGLLIFFQFRLKSAKEGVRVLGYSYCASSPPPFYTSARQYVGSREYCAEAKPQLGMPFLKHWLSDGGCWC